MADIGIVIVTYNSGGEIGACLDAALRDRRRDRGGGQRVRDDTIAEVDAARCAA